MRSLGLSFIACLLVTVCSMIFVSNQSSSIIQGGEFSNGDLWLTQGNATIQNGYVVSQVNDTEGPSWSWSKVQQGILPHRWTFKDSIKEIEFRKGIEAEKDVVFCRVIANRSDFQYYNESESWVNFQVGLYFQLDENYNGRINESTQLSVSFFLAKTRYQNGTAEFMYEDYDYRGNPPWDDDLHLEYTVPNQMLESGKWYDISFDVGSAIGKAFGYFGIQKAKLKNVDVLIEANYGYGKVQVDYLELKFEPKLNSSYVIVNSFLYGFLTFIAIFFISFLLKILRF